MTVYRPSVSSDVSSDCRLAGHKGGGEMGTAERWQHAGRVFEPSDEAGGFVARVLDEDILDRLVLAGVIARRHRDAGVRFRRDFHAAGMAAHLAGSYSPVRGAFSYYGGWDERTDAQEEAYQRWRKGVEAMGGVFGGVVISAVCYEEEVAEERQILLLGGLIKLMRWYARGVRPACR